MRGEPKSFDLVIIGGGPAGLIGAITAIALGKTVAVVNDDPELGGAGINTGTVPSKTLRETALALSGLKSRNLHGVDLSLRREVTVADFMRHERRVRSGFHEMLTRRVKADTIDVYAGAGVFEDGHTIRVLPPGNSNGRPAGRESGEVLLHGDSILIATGSSPFRPTTFPFDLPGVYDSDTILQLHRLPQTLVVVGAGVIGSEYACTFNALGADVQIIDGRDVLLPFLDGELSRALVSAMERSGIVFTWRERVENCTCSSPDEIVIALTSGRTVTTDAVLVAAGRTSNTETLNLSAAGVRVGERGLIPVDENCRTNVAHIYAAGDVIGFPALASASMEQGRRAVRHASGASLTKGASLIPSGIYTIPEASAVGATEESLKKEGVPYVVGRASYRENARGRIIGDEDGFLKLLFHGDTMQLLGIHIMGEQATEVVHIGLMAMLAGVSAQIFDEACFNSPTLGTLYKEATLDALKQRGAGSDMIRDS